MCAHANIASGKISAAIQSYKDKSFDFKLRLWEEGHWLQVAFGKRDIAGTGLFDGEYLVASKQAGPFDFTLRDGMGLRR